MRKKVDGNILLNEWLLIYHGVDIDEVKRLHPKWAKAEREFAQINSYPQDKRDKISERMNSASREFFEEYTITNDEYDEWVEWGKEYIKRITKVSKKIIEKEWPWIDLQVSPMVKKEKEDEKV